MRHLGQSSNYTSSLNRRLTFLEDILILRDRYCALSVPEKSLALARDVKNAACTYARTFSSAATIHETGSTDYETAGTVLRL